MKISQKQIMISYARQEAADHALKLKESLIKKGFSVYLVRWVKGAECAEYTNGLHFAGRARDRDGQ